jgi:hypothetical protein
MSKKLYVGGLAWATTDESLTAAFAPFGKLVSAKVVKDRETGRSRGFGFVEYETEDEAKKAMDAMNNQQVDGRQIRIDLAQERGAGGPGGPRRFGGGGGPGGGYGGGGGGGYGGGGGGGFGGPRGGPGGGGGFGGPRGFDRPPRGGGFGGGGFGGGGFGPPPEQPAPGRREKGERRKKWEDEGGDEF